MNKSFLNRFIGMLVVMLLFVAVSNLSAQIGGPSNGGGRKDSTVKGGGPIDSTGGKGRGPIDSTGGKGRGPIDSTGGKGRGPIDSTGGKGRGPIDSTGGKGRGPIDSTGGKGRGPIDSTGGKGRGPIDSTGGKGRGPIDSTGGKGRGPIDSTGGKGRGPGEGRGPGNGGSVDPCWDRIQLTDAQKERIRMMMESFNAEHQGDMQNLRTLRDAVKAAREAGDQDAAKRAMDALKAAQDAIKAARARLQQDIMSVLTEEQKQQLDRCHRILNGGGLKGGGIANPSGGDIQ